MESVIEVHGLEKRYQVFISSTFEDLKNVRQELSLALLRTNCFPAGMELFPATNEEQLDYIKETIDQSDYYIIISSGRYGSIHERTGLSYTEMEYDYAVSSEKAVIRLLHRDPFNKLMGEFVEKTDDGRRKLTLFRQKMTKDNLVRFWESPHELMLEAVLALNEAQKRFPQPGWTRGGFENTQKETPERDSHAKPPSPTEMDDLISRINNVGHFGIYFEITCFLADIDDKGEEDDDQGIGPIYGHEISGPSFLELILIGGLRTDWLHLGILLQDWSEEHCLFDSYTDFLMNAIWSPELWEGLSNYNFADVPVKAIELSKIGYCSTNEAYLLETLRKQISEDRFERAFFSGRPVDILNDNTSTFRALNFLYSIGLIELDHPDELEQCNYRLTNTGKVIARHIKHAPYDL
ncbi:MAG: DUF4062 domain-containing protein [Neomegalonema sp.]|nr:DUF4062 domain-containing protein [Neomegalonema sp.]